MPELPEVETVRRNLEATVVGRTIASVWRSGKKLRARITPELDRRVRGRRLDAVRRHGKYLLLDLHGGSSLISHLGMSGRWLFFSKPPSTVLPHVHVKMAFRGGGALWFQDPRRFGLLRLARTDRLDQDPALALLGPDPVATPPSGDELRDRARGTRVAIKNFLLDQRRMAGIGNIYASEILHRAGVDPRRRAGSLAPHEWVAVARETTQVLGEAIARFGTTFSTYRTLWNETGSFGDQLRVYDREGEACRECGTPIRRVVQAQRSTYYCPSCQGRAGRGPHRSKGFSVARRPAGA